MYSGVVAMSETVSQSDKEIVESILQDRQQFTQLIARFEAPLRRYLNRLGVKAKEDVDDLLQESFIKTYLNLNDFDTARTLSAWVYRIVHNETISFFRKNKIRPQAVASEDDLFLFEQIRDDTNLEVEGDKALLQSAIREAINKLPDKYRDVIILRFLEEKSYEEIADILQTPSGTVATYMNRGKKMLRKVLLADYNEITNSNDKS